MKIAQVKPLLNSPKLDPNKLKNYRPVSNLSYISKLLESVVARRLNNHMITNGLHEPLQSAYKSGHSTETALLRVHNDVFTNMDNQSATVLVLLDLSAAFDTIDHSVWFHWLPVSSRIDYKLAVTAFRAKHGLAPDYINELALPHSVSRTLRSTDANLLHVPKSNIVKGDRAFMIVGPKVWNSLPSNIRAITNLVDFKKKLKIFFYRKAFM